MIDAKVTAILVSEGAGFPGVFDFVKFGEEIYTINSIETKGEERRAILKFHLSIERWEEEESYKADWIEDGVIFPVKVVCQIADPKTWIRREDDRW
jgi:hypothetical protein